jgi:hypothetical protein
MKPDCLSLLNEKSPCSPFLSAFCPRQDADVSAHLRKSAAKELGLCFSFAHFASFAVDDFARG